jgi:hypothetical protein
MPSVPQKVIAAADVLWDILETKGPGPKTGLSGEMAHQLGRPVSPRHFADALQYCRRVHSAQHRKSIAYSHALNAYGFPEDLASAEVHIVRFNGSYLAARAETCLVQAQAAEQAHGASPALTQFQHIDGAFAFAMRALVEQFLREPVAERTNRAAHRTGANASVRLVGIEEATA